MRGRHGELVVRVGHDARAGRGRAGGAESRNGGGGGGGGGGGDDVGVEFAGEAGGAEDIRVL